MGGSRCRPKMLPRDAISRCCPELAIPTYHLDIYTVSRCRPEMPSRDAVPKCHPEMPSRDAISRCRPEMPSRDGGSNMPSRDDSIPSRSRWSVAVWNCSDASRDRRAYLGTYVHISILIRPRPEMGASQTHLEMSADAIESRGRSAHLETYPRVSRQAYCISR